MYFFFLNFWKTKLLWSLRDVYFSGCYYISSCLLGIHWFLSLSLIDCWLKARTHWWSCRRRDQSRWSCTKTSRSWGGSCCATAAPRWPPASSRRYFRAAVQLCSVVVSVRLRFVQWLLRFRGLREHSYGIRTIHFKICIKKLKRKMGRKCLALELLTVRLADCPLFRWRAPGGRGPPDTWGGAAQTVRAHAPKGKGIGGGSFI